MRARRLPIFLASAALLCGFQSSAAAQSSPPDATAVVKTPASPVEVGDLNLGMVEENFNFTSLLNAHDLGSRTRVSNVATTSLATHNYTVLVVPVTWGSATLDLTAQHVATLVGGSVNTWWATASNNQVGFTAVALPTIKLPTTQTCSDPYFLPNLQIPIDAAVTAAGYDINNVHILTYIPASDNAGCYWAGKASLGADLTKTSHRLWINGPSGGDANLAAVIEHELGHTFGLNHADAQQCYTSAAHTAFTPYSNYCTVNPYLDSYDMMGSGGTGSLMGPWQDQLGLMAGQKVVVGSSQTVTLSPLSTFQGTREVILNHGTESWELEYRTASGLDAATINNIFHPGPGVVIHRTDRSNPTYPADWYMVHPHISGPYWDASNSALAPGETFTPTPWLTLHVNSETSSAASVTITRTPDTTPPAAFTIDASWQGDQNASWPWVVSWQATEDPQTGVAKYEVYLDGTLVNTIQATPGYNYLDYTSPTTPSGGNHTVSIKATDDAGNTTTATSVLVVPQPIGVTQAPTALLRTGATVTLTSVPTSISYRVNQLPCVVTIDGRNLYMPDPSGSLASAQRPGAVISHTLRAAGCSNRTYATVTGPARKATLTVTPGGTYSGAWSTLRQPTALGGSERATKIKNGKWTVTFTGYGFGLVAKKGPTRSKIAVYVDKVYKGTLDEYSKSLAAPITLYTVSTSNAKHTVTFVNLGTKGRPTMAIDGFVVLN